MSSIAHSHSHNHSDKHGRALKVAELRSATPETASREPLGHLLVERLLREAGFQGEVSSRFELLDKYSTDESIFSIRPQVVIQPMDARDVEIAVTILGKETERFPSLSLTPRAAGTGLGGGSLTDSVVIDMKEHMNRVLRVGREDGRVTFTSLPGAMWRDVEAELKKYDSYLPSYPASKQICTIGGAVANNAAGPDSLRFGHAADWIESLDVVLHDGKTYTITPLSYQEFKKISKEKNALGKIATEIFALIEKNEATIKRAKPKTAKNTAGYPLWSVIDTSVEQFKKGQGTFDLTRLIAGSQGTIGIITSLTMRAEPIAHDVDLVAVPVFNLSSAGKVVLESLKFDPINVEVFDALTYSAAMKNPTFFRSRLSGYAYYRMLVYLYSTYSLRWWGKLPEFVLLVTLNQKKLSEIRMTAKEIAGALRQAGGGSARLITNRHEREMFWAVRDSSFLLSKLLDPKKRPAAFLEDMTVPPEHLAKFFTDIKFLLNKFKVTAAVHGHGGNAHFHFYPLLDFTNKTTPALIMKMADEFFKIAIKYQGSICGEHNDGIIRTPYLSMMFGRNVLKLFEQVEHIFDPKDIFNPGKKVHPRFDIQSSIRKKN
ncbi:MAG: FAD-binding oxidoreductase [Candidatus Paceibacterota bacterium]